MKHKGVRVVKSIILAFFYTFYFLFLNYISKNVNKWNIMTITTSTAIFNLKNYFQNYHLLFLIWKFVAFYLIYFFAKLSWSRGLGRIELVKVLSWIGRVSYTLANNNNQPPHTVVAMGPLKSKE